MRIFALSGEDILATQHLTRWHMVRTRRHQSLAEHLGTVAMFCAKITQMWGCAEDLVHVLDHALTHDAHEVEFGDLPAIMKSYVPADTEAAMESHFWDRRTNRLVDVNPRVRQIVHLADKLEATLFYLLEGSDPSLQTKLEATLYETAAKAPPIVELWVRDLVKSVRHGTFTPQPSKERARP